MFLHVYRMTLLFLFLVLVLAVPAHAQLLNPSPGGLGTMAVFSPGPVHITGNSGNGSDQISNVNVNGAANAVTFAGADLGAKINAAMASMPNGGTIYIPAGTYSFSTTVQCPVTGAGSNAYIISGAGSSMAPDHGPNANTLLLYTGTGDAFNQVVTVFADQNQSGCQLRDFSLNGANAGPAAIGYHFGGTEHSSTWNVVIQNFGGAGIEIENGPTGEWTERYELHGMLWSNTIGINLIVDTGGNASLGHGYINEWFNTANNGVMIQMSGTGPTGDTAQIYSSVIMMNGNLGTGTGTTATVWKLLNGAYVEPCDIFEGYECDSTSCVETNLAAGTQFNTPVRNGRAGGPWTSVGTGNLAVIPPPGEHIMSASAPAALGGNAFGWFPMYLISPNGSLWGTGPQQIAMTCVIVGSCTTYPTFQVYDVTAGADATGAAITCVNGNATNSNHYSLTPQHFYTARTSVAGVGCSAPLMVTVDQVW
jgi:hypothetical protein